MSPPLYQRIKDHIVGRIQSGDWPVDHRVPSENELLRQFKTSRMTVNRALRELTDQGLLRRVQGLGTFVADPRPRLQLLEIRNIADDIRGRDHRHDCEVHLQGAERAGEAVALDLGLEIEAEVFHSLLVHHEEGVPVQLEDRYVNPAVAPGYLDIDFTRTTPNEYLMRAAPLQEVEHTLEAILPDAETQALLRITADEPCLLLHRHTWSGGRAASRAWLTHPGGRYRLGARFIPDRG